jgi:hypothetical protein
VKHGKHAWASEIHKLVHGGQMMVLRAATSSEEIREDVERHVNGGKRLKETYLLKKKMQI